MPMAKQEPALREDVLNELEKESRLKEHSGIVGKIITAICLSFTCFQLYTAIFGVLDAHLQRAVHLGFGLALVFLLKPSFNKDHSSSVHPWDLLLAVLGAACPAYIVIQYKELVGRAGLMTTEDYVVGAVGVVLVIEATRRIVGIPMVTVVAIFLAYAFLGPYMPDAISHRG